MEAVGIISCISLPPFLRRICGIKGVYIVKLPFGTPFLSQMFLLGAGLITSQSGRCLMLPPDVADTSGSCPWCLGTKKVFLVSMDSCLHPLPLAQPLDFAKEGINSQRGESGLPEGTQHRWDFILDVQVLSVELCSRCLARYGDWAHA